MDINFPLVLLCLVVAGTIIWLVDLFWLGRTRGDQEPEPFLVENAKSLTPVLALVFFFRSFLYEPFQIPSASMERTLLTGDFILVNKFVYGIRLPVWRNKVIDNGSPERGDVMVFFPPHEDRYFIKRVIGLPGDLVQYKNRVLFINGEEQAQSAIDGGRRSLYHARTEILGDVEHDILINTSAPERPDQSFRIKDGHYFMMGDNRDNSQDSRYWGQVPEERIVGKAVAIWMHKKPGWHMPTFSRFGSFK